MSKNGSYSNAYLYSYDDNGQLSHTSSIQTKSPTELTYTKAKPGDNLYFKVCALSERVDNGIVQIVENEYSDTVPGTMLLAKVNGFKAILTDKGKVKLSWSKLKSASEYEVWYSTSQSGEYTKLADVSGTSFTHSKGEKGTTYYYKVRAVNKNGVFSVFSNVVRKTPSK